MPIPLPFLLLPGALLAEPAQLQSMATAAVINGEVWFHPGDLLVGNPSLPGRPAVRPLQGNAPFMLPMNLKDYDLLSRPCPRSLQEAQDAWTRTSAAPEPAPLARGDLLGDGVVETIVVERTSPTAAPVIKVLRGRDPLAVATLPVSAWPCAALVTEANADDSPDLLLVWTSWGGEIRTVGVNVYQLPGAR